MIAFCPRVFENTVFHRMKIAPIHERFAELLNPAKLLIQPRQVHVGRAIGLRSINQLQHLRTPADQGAKIHVSSFDFLRRRRQVAQLGLLYLRLGLAAVFHKGVPVWIGQKLTLQHDGCLVSNVIEYPRFRVFSKKSVSTPSDVRAMIAQDSARNTDPLRSRFQLLVDFLAVRFLHRFERDKRQILVREGLGELFPGRQSNADNQQALQLAQLYRVIHDEDPVVGLVLWPQQLVKPQSQQPGFNRAWCRRSPKLRKLEDTIWTRRTIS